MERTKDKRGDKLYVDTGQTGRSRTIVAPYSVRAHPGATVSTPLRWEELHLALDPSILDIRRVPARIQELGDPMSTLLEQEPDLTAAVRAARRLAALLRKEETGNLADALGTMAGTPLARLGESLGRDAAAIQSALDLPWTTSPVEGHVNRIKMLKRAMYGRAGFHLLRQRVLLAA
jgi:hypothetical protein